MDPSSSNVCWTRKFDFNLKNTSVPYIDVVAGTGEANVNLLGDWDNDLHAEFTCGIGQITLLLPKDVNIKVHTTGLLGSTSAKGFHKKDKRNYIYTTSKDTDVTFYLDITGGIGAINLELNE